MRTDTPEMYWGKHLWMDWGSVSRSWKGKLSDHMIHLTLGKGEGERGPGRKSLRSQHGPEKTSARLIDSPQVESPIEAGTGSCWHPYHALSLAESCHLMVWWRNLNTSITAHLSCFSCHSTNIQWASTNGEQLRQKDCPHGAYSLSEIQTHKGLSSVSSMF